MKFKDYYAALEVPRDADAETIKKAYRRLARKYHPDVSKEPGAEARFKEVNEAYDTLRDAEKRAAYDALGQRRPGEEFEAPQDWREHFASGAFAGFEDVDLADLLDALGRHHRGARGHAPRPRAGRDYDLTAALSVEDAHRGTTLELQLQRPEGPQTLHVTVPPGVTEGQKLRLRGKGGPGRDGGPAGDIYVHLQLLPHPRYRVDGKDLYFDLALAPWEAALGAQVEVPTLDGDVLLTVPPGTHSAQKLRLRGRGLGAGADRGNLYAVVHIEVPPTLSARERELFEALAQESRFDPRSQQGEAQR
ncbi:MAG TPA: DnaJ C-terminal domain-containing protein [Ramlibacter sp.]|uniref:DnaJ C-terminal domain-containing protein n=1 Tax=Ramlibacter sp. TaxID=1917967 RepID=UPI002D7FDA2C|nr:DnaJ C-terminal domain-containing protein [Ramlibacter sp.]HET8747720.1 DnaJ C-terminal domain-containing protein [Ramlibacter sp.]